MANRIVLGSASAFLLGTVVIVSGCARKRSADTAKEAARSAVAIAPVPGGSDAAIAPPKREAETRFAIELQSGPYKLRGFVVKPEGDGPFPVVVYNHGSENDPSEKWLSDVAEWFRSKGYVAFFPFRRGAGGSEGPYWEDVVNARPRDERNEATVEQLELQNDDVLAAIEWIAEKPYVDKTHIAVAGCSFGGIETVLAAERSKTIYAAVDFAGASMSWNSSMALQDRMRLAVRAARVPVFFLQAKNDFNTAPSRDLAAQMTEVRKPHALKIFPAHGETHMAGHAGFCMHGFDEWGEDVLRFLREPSTTTFAAAHVDP